MPDLNVYTGKQLQDFRSLITIFIDDGVMDSQEILAEVNRQIGIKLKGVQSRPVAGAGYCPKCGKILLLLPVNMSPSTMVGGDYTHVRLCRSCHYEEWI